MFKIPYYKQNVEMSYLSTNNSDINDTIMLKQLGLQRFLPKRNKTAQKRENNNQNVNRYSVQLSQSPQVFSQRKIKNKSATRKVKISPQKFMLQVQQSRIELKLPESYKDYIQFRQFNEIQIQADLLRGRIKRSNLSSGKQSIQQIQQPDFKDQQNIWFFQMDEKTPPEEYKELAAILEDKRKEYAKDMMLDDDYQGPALRVIQSPLAQNSAKPFMSQQWKDLYHQYMIFSEIKKQSLNDLRIQAQILKLSKDEQEMQPFNERQDEKFITMDEIKQIQTEIAKDEYQRNLFGLDNIIQKNKFLAAFERV